ncbi:MAG: glycosyltransferase family 4 protein, partial [Sphingomonadaceae bacterium]
MAELIEDGVTGLLIDHPDEAVAAIGAVDTLDRARVRRVAETRFSIDRMADAYINLYRHILGRGQ